MLDAANPEGAVAPGATVALATFIASMRETPIPEELHRVLQDALTDAVGCGLFGLTTPACAILQAYAVEQGGAPVASIWCGSGMKVSAANAALAAGTAIHGFDFDDHHRAKIHPGAAVIPAALALAEQHHADGATFLKAIAAGYETMVRVSLAANPNSSRMRGWHLTGTTGTFGAAAAASVILGLDAETTASALGLAGTQSAGLWAFNADGAMSKRLHPGRAAQSGIVAAELAQRGFHGPRMILETEDGGFLAATSDDVRLGEATRDLGQEWRAEGVCFKPYSCCGSNHASVDAAVFLMAEHGFSAADIDRVTVGISRVVERQTGFVYRPNTVLNAQMSLRFNVAVAFVDGTALIEQFTPARIVDTVVCDLASRVDVEVDPEMDAIYPGRYAGIVHVLLRNGRQFSKRVDYSRGMPECPMDAAALRAKFFSLANDAVGQNAAEAVFATLQTAFTLPDMAVLARTLGELPMPALQA